MSNDSKNNKIHSIDTNLNSTPMPAENKTEFLDFDTCMARLRAISGESRDSKAVAYFAIPYSTYSNWLRRGRVSCGTLVQALLAHGTSLDQFFAPQQHLTYPTGLAESQALGIAEEFDGLTHVQLTLKAMARIEPLLRELNLQFSESKKELLIETYLGQRNEVVSLNFALRQVAKALAHQD